MKAKNIIGIRAATAVRPKPSTPMLKSAVKSALIKNPAKKPKIRSRAIKKTALGIRSFSPTNLNPSQTKKLMSLT